MYSTGPELSKNFIAEFEENTRRIRGSFFFFSAWRMFGKVYYLLSKAVGNNAKNLLSSN